MKPSCFVIMPFGKKEYKVKGAKKATPPFSIDFNAVYKNFIEKAIRRAGMEPIRADHEEVDGIIHKPMFERIILCDYVVADMTGANANAFYELGVRHAVKPYTTVCIFNSNSELPFDVGPNRSMPYTCDEKGKIADLQKKIQALTEKLKMAKDNKTTDSPIYQLVDGMQVQNSVDHEKTDIFRKQVTYNKKLKTELEKARNKKGAAAVKAIDTIVKKKLQPLADQEAGVLVDVMLSYRDMKEYKRMVDFIESLPTHIQQTAMLQEQYGFGLNRLKRRNEAETVLQSVLDKYGASSETYGILGRVYKDWFDEYGSKNSKADEAKAAGYLDKAMVTYLKGFQADWRDSYPGVNAVTLAALKGNDAVVKQLAPVVEYSSLRKMATKKPDYWDYATLLELCVINNDEAKAKEYVEKALAGKPQSWMTETTVKNLQLISRYRKKAGKNTRLIEDVIDTLKP